MKEAPRLQVPKSRAIDAHAMRKETQYVESEKTRLKSELNSDMQDLQQIIKLTSV